MENNDKPAPADAGSTIDVAAAREAIPEAGAAAESSVVPEDPLAAAQARLAELEAKHADVADAYLRAKAEAENVRRRSEEEMTKVRKFAIEAFAESLLPVKDSLEASLAIQNATPEQVLEGVHATLRQLKAVLERNKVMEVAPASGAKFDPHQHQAISVVPAPGQEPNTVVAVLQKGYVISDRVLRPALVTVSGPAS